jgi:glycolate oxidase FAD binding subunit
MATPASALPSLAAIVGVAHSRLGSADDVFLGVQPACVVEPGSVEQAAQVLKLASSEDLGVVVRGAGTELGCGAPPQRADVLLITTRLDRVVEHSAGDLVVIAQAGVRLTALQQRLAQAGQWLALDPPEPAATLGGIVAASASGPRRYRYGTARDLLIGVTVVLADGTVARAGGKVVKNVAGYDLCKLFTGSFGTLGVVVETTFRLHPLPQARCLVVVDLDSPESLGSAMQAVLHSDLVPSAVELRWSESVRCLALLIEGVPAGVAAQAAGAQALLGAQGRVRVVGDESFASEWTRVTERPYGSEDLGLKLSGPLAAVPELLRALASVAGGRSLPWRVGGQAGNGVLYAGVRGGSTETRAAVISELRARLSPAEASVVVVQAAPEVMQRVDVWGYSGDALELMRAVKQRFDPRGTLGAGRFVGGI